jgi:hypothetical protein
MSNDDLSSHDDYRERGPSVHILDGPARERREESFEDDDFG